MNLEEYGSSALYEAIRLGSTVTEIDDTLWEHCSDAASNACIYYSDCIDIIGRYESQVSGDFVDDEGPQFSASEWLQAATVYAQAIALEFIHNQAREELETLTEAIDLVKAEVERLGGDVDLVTIHGQDHGWAAHNYETADGVMIWSDEDTPYSYNPELLDGDLFAVQFDFEGVHISACWAPEAVTTLLKDAI